MSVYIPFIEFDFARYIAIPGLSADACTVAKILQQVPMTDALRNSWPMAWFQLGLHELIKHKVVICHVLPSSIPRTPELPPPEKLSILASYTWGRADPIGVRFTATRDAAVDRASVVRWMCAHADWAIEIEPREPLPRTLRRHRVPMLRGPVVGNTTCMLDLPIAGMYDLVSRLIAAPKLPVAEVEAAMRCGGYVYRINVDELRSTAQSVKICN